MKRKYLLGVPVAFVVLVAVILFRPIDTGPYESHPAPARSYSDAVARVDSLRRLEAEAVVPECRTQLLSHGGMTRRVIVFVHGYTSCPAQFMQLAAPLHAEGHNILIVPMPLHGFPDRMSGDHAELTAQQLARYGDSVIDVARGLGEEITIAGLSAGGTVAGWAAQNRGDVDLAVLISPVFGYEVVPPVVTLAAARIFAVLPDKFEWWDPQLGEGMEPKYAYPRYSRRALAQLLMLGAAVMEGATDAGPAANDIVVVTNAGDHMISNWRINRMVDLWRQSARARLTVYEFPDSIGVGHDLIDPNQKDQRMDVVYPKLIELMRR